MSSRSLEGRTAWYRRKPVLLSSLIFSAILFAVTLICNFIPQLGRNSSIHEKNDRVLFAFQIVTTVFAFLFILLMAFRWFVNIFTHKPPQLWRIAGDIILCMTTLTLIVTFLLFGDSALQKSAFWVTLLFVMNLSELFIHLLHRQRVNRHQEPICL